VHSLSVLTELTIEKLLANDRHNQRMRRLAREAAKVGVRLGVIRQNDFREEQFFKSFHERIADHRSAVLQDFQKGKQLEIPKMLEAVELLARAPGPAPAVDIPAIKELDREVKRKLAERLINEK
jgi:ketopantoate reductase